ncbi:hypothetical protein LOAG_11038 [Loa loa]|uniref:Uncharacterized protein n=1 Tax=Loa loa TaxID=7209 RepID=A0A1S0TP94_LOALO|nr:hypothetical protein LOAG_11038 [Loa loa]EFO17464.1 hypothetical protein LOAG_11038 [Loa loa]
MSNLECIIEHISFTSICLNTEMFTALWWISCLPPIKGMAFTDVAS